MKCGKCGFENKDNAKFCTKCGGKLEVGESVNVSQKSNNSKYVIALLVVIIIILISVIGFYAFNMGSGSGSVSTNDNISQESTSSVQSDSNDGETTQEISSTKQKSWESIGSYSGSGTGSQTISVPSGKIMVKLSAFPIKNYADNHLYVTGPNGATGGVEWGPTSDVETRSDSFEFTASSSQTFTIDYYETVSWEVEFLRYQ